MSGDLGMGSRIILVILYEGRHRSGRRQGRPLNPIDQLDGLMTGDSQFCVGLWFALPAVRSAPLLGHRLHTLSSNRHDEAMAQSVLQRTEHPAMRAFDR
jgi:hypothetical protein